MNHLVMLETILIRDNAQPVQYVFYKMCNYDALISSEIIETNLIKLRS